MDKENQNNLNDTSNNLPEVSEFDIKKMLEELENKGIEVEKEEDPDLIEQQTEYNGNNESKQKSSSFSIDNTKIQIKKFVIKIDKDNVDFFESYAPSERDEIINDFLVRKQLELTSTSRKEDFENFFKHLIVAILTIIISLPICYILINYSITNTIQNYKATQINFQKLYKKDKPLQKKDLSKLKRM